MDELIEVRGQGFTCILQYYCHFDATELVWSQDKRYYNSNIGRNEFGMEAVKNMWEESVEHICMFVCFSLTTKQKFGVSYKITSTANLFRIVL
jgi:hypothetical protein